MARVVATVHEEIGVFIAGHRVEMTALLEIFLNFRPQRGDGSYDDRRVLAPIEAQPDLDLDLYARELVELFSRAVTA